MGERKKEERMAENDDVYDKYGFRKDEMCTQLSNEQAVPSVILRNQEHKWRRILDPLTFPLTPRTKIESLIYEGVPDSIRSDVWTALIRSNNLPRTDDMYRKFLLMPDNKAVEQIKLDLARTLTHHKMFEEKGGEGQQKLYRVLKAYSYYNSEVSYCQGMSYLAAILLTVLPEEEAFHGLCQVVGGMNGYFVPSMWELLEDGKIFKNILADKMPKVHDHLQDNGILPLMFICKWFMTMFSQLPWPTALRIFDLYLLEGKTALFRFGYSILDVHQQELLNLKSIDVLLPYLLEPSSKKLQAHILVNHALSVPMEHFVRMAVNQLRDGQDVLNRMASAGTPKHRVSDAHRAASSSSTASATAAAGASSFFDRFIETIATPVRSAVKKKVDTSVSDKPRVVATPPRRKALDFASANSPVRSPNRAAMTVLSPTSAKLNTPPMFQGMKKRIRPLDGGENTNATQIPLSPLKYRGVL